jgi:GT2 family glycosyltransferase
VIGICTIVVTRNRRSQLRRCLNALAAQTRPPDRVLVVDNASTDGTASMLHDEYPEVDRLGLSTNEGGAGGFHEGMRRAHADGAEWLWLMDDDTLPAPDALAQLLDAAARLDRGSPPSLLASKVVWRDGRVHPMNFPTPERRRMERVVDAAQRGLMAMRSATFVSLLVHRRTIDRHGLPLKAFFIWSDDIEYTARILRREPVGWLVPESVAEHRTPRAYTAVSDSGERFYFHVRNWLYMLRGGSFRGAEKASLAWWLLLSLRDYVRVNRARPASVRTVVRGLRDGLRRAPTSSRAEA